MITARVMRLRPDSGSHMPSPNFVRKFPECPQIGSRVMIRESGHRVLDVIWLSEKEAKHSEIDCEVQVSWT